MSERLSFNKEELLTHLGNPEFAMAYGSGVFKQEGYTAEDKPMIDFILGVNDTKEWHAGNLERNPDDYSPLIRVFREKLICFLNSKGAKIYYNPYADFQEREIKYGVTSTEDLKRDLEEWTYLYAAGRLQKPVEVINSTDEITSAMNQNLNQALVTALTMLDEKFTDLELFEAITRLSYMGDVRNLIGGENPNKVKNIVGKNPDGFRELYRNVIENNSKMLTTLNDGQMERDMSLDAGQRIYEKLAINVQRKVDYPEREDELSKMNEQVEDRVKQIVRMPSLAQILLPIIEVSPKKAIRYASAKLRKGRRR